jgi:uncharacterized protein YwqG
LDDINSQLGGYAYWIQSYEECAKGKQLLFQIASEDNAALMWGDGGAVYVFYDPDTMELEFVFQCY